MKHTTRSAQPVGERRRVAPAAHDRDRRVRVVRRPHERGRRLDAHDRVPERRAARARRRPSPHPRSTVRRPGAGQQLEKAREVVELEVVVEPRRAGPADPTLGLLLPRVGDRRAAVVEARVAHARRRRIDAASALRRERCDRFAVVTGRRGAARSRAGRAVRGRSRGSASASTSNVSARRVSKRVSGGSGSVGSASWSTIASASAAWISSSSRNRSAFALRIR